MNARVSQMMRSACSRLFGPSYPKNLERWAKAEYRITPRGPGRISRAVEAVLRRHEQSEGRAMLRDRRRYR